MPNFRKLREQGSEMVLESKYPPITPSAWMSLSTGLKPAKHGVYDFWTYGSQQGQQGRQFPTNTQVVTHRKSGKAIWNILSEYGKHVLVINVPVTYPPEPVHGSMISGYMTPGEQTSFTYPEALKDELYRAVPDYKIDLQKDDIQSVETTGKMDRLVDATLFMTQKRIDLTLHLMKERPWDFCYVAFVGADRLQHPLWDDIVSLNPKAVEYFHLLDEGLGRILEQLGPDDRLFVVSDHGFQGAGRSFEINEYLYSRNLLGLNPATLQSRKQLKRRNQFKRTLQRLGLLNAARLAKRNVTTTGAVKEVFDDVCEPMGDEFDWQQTQAFVPSHSSTPGGYADIFFTGDIEPDRLAELCEDLKRQKDPSTGQALVDAVYTTEVFGQGPYAPAKPHLLILPNEGITFRMSIGNEHLWDDARTRHDPEKRCGVHHKDGVMYAYGGGVRAGFSAPNAEVYDLVPTVLHSMGLPLPEELDGHVLQHLFLEPSLARVQEHSLEESTNSIVSRKLKKLQRT